MKDLILELRQRLEARHAEAMEALNKLEAMVSEPVAAVIESGNAGQGRPIQLAPKTLPPVKRASAPSGNGELSLADAVREEIRKFGAKEFTVLEVRCAIRRTNAKLIDGRESAVGVTLITMVKAGELTREGSGRDTRYRAATPGARKSSAPAISEKERAYQELRKEIKLPHAEEPS